jgi:glyceraldehyde-3-phosphate dehydrogenase (NAD(P))
MYARGINDEALVRDEDRFLHVVSCNTHNIAVLVKSLAIDADGVSHLENGRFLCMRRANDISQDGSFIPSPTVGSHDDPVFGTHHARDTHGLFATLGYDLPVFSSAVKINTQYMHALHFSLTLDHEVTVDEALDLLKANTRVALTHRTSANQIFSFGRDHGFFGRILSQTVVPVQTVTVRGGNEIVGFCFTPQDGNALLSSVAATLWYLHPAGFEDRIDVLRPYLFREV